MNQILQVLVKRSCIFLLLLVSCVAEAQSVTSKLSTEEEAVSAVKIIKNTKCRYKQARQVRQRSKPFNATIAFAQSRIDYQANRYAQTQGVYVRSHYAWFINQLDRVSVLLSYRGERESVVTTPEPNTFDQNTMLNDVEAFEESMGRGVISPSFERPKAIRSTWAGYKI